MRGARAPRKGSAASGHGRRAPRLSTSSRYEYGTSTGRTRAARRAPVSRPRSVSAAKTSARYEAIASVARAAYGSARYFFCVWSARMLSHARASASLRDARSPSSFTLAVTFVAVGTRKRRLGGPASDAGATADAPPLARAVVVARAGARPAPSGRSSAAPARDGGANASAAGSTARTSSVRRRMLGQDQQRGAREMS